jgi:hypothetical protein
MSFHARTKAALIGVGLVALALLSAGPAVAATTTSVPSVTPFSCRASTTRLTLLNAITVEPLVANNPDTPCKSDSHGVSSVNVPTTGMQAVNAGPAAVLTDSVFAPVQGAARGAAAVSDVQGVVIPTSAGEISVVGPVTSSASYGCSNGTLVSASGSTLDILYIAGKAIALPSPGASMTIQLGGGSFVAINEKTTTATSITERVLHVHLQGIADIVVGEATVDYSGSDPCAGSNGPPPNLNACPDGSTLDPVHLVCVIILPGGIRIIVGPPFTGPSGGTVLAVSVARKRFHSPCLFGPGPKYALIATKAHGRVTGTLRSDRILALGNFERVAGLGGNDCIDGKGRNQILWDGSGKDRIYGGTGKTRIGVANGNVKIFGRKGQDWITAGNGNDLIYGGSKGSRIDVGLGKSHVYGGAGNDRIYAASGHALVSCGSGKHNLAFLRTRPAKYAAKHGCQRIILLK